MIKDLRSFNPSIILDVEYNESIEIKMEQSWSDYNYGKHIIKVQSHSELRLFGYLEHRTQRTH